MTIRVLVIDDHPLVRAGVRSELEKSDVIEVVGDAADVDSAVEACHSLQPDVALLDVHRRGPGGGAKVRRPDADAVPCPVGLGRPS